MLSESFSSVQRLASGVVSSSHTSQNPDKFKLQYTGGHGRKLSNSWQARVEDKSKATSDEEAKRNRNGAHQIRLLPYKKINRHPGGTIIYLHPGANSKRRKAESRTCKILKVVKTFRANQGLRRGRFSIKCEFRLHIGRVKVGSES